MYTISSCGKVGDHSFSGLLHKTSLPGTNRSKTRWEMMRIKAKDELVESAAPVDDGG